MFKKYWLRIIAIMCVGLFLREIGILRTPSFLMRPGTMQDSAKETYFSWHGEMPPETTQVAVFDAKQPGRHVLVSEWENTDGFTADIQRFDVFGRTYMPFNKSGGCTYAVEVFWKKQRFGRVDGRIDFSIKGPCSMSEYRAVLWNQMMDNITAYVGCRTKRPPETSPEIQEPE